MKKVESIIKNERDEKNQKIYEKNQNLMSEIDQINKLIKIKSNKIEEIKSSKNYINKYINEKHFSSKTEEDYQYRIKMLNKLKNDYIKILRLIESNKKLINRNEEEIK